MRRAEMWSPAGSPGRREARTCCRARLRARTQAVTADPAAAHLTSPGAVGVEAGWGRGKERGWTLGLWTRLGWPPAHHGRFSTPGSSLSHFQHLLAPSRAPQTRKIVSPTPPIPAGLLGGPPGNRHGKAQGGGGRGDRGRRGGLQRHHSSSSSYRGAGVAGARPPAQNTPSSASPSSSQTSSPPPQGAQCWEAEEREVAEPRETREGWR